MSSARCEKTLNFLQEVLNKDPESYKADFDEQFLQFFHTMKVLNLDPNLDKTDLEALLDLINFISHSCVHYPRDAENYADCILLVLRNKGQHLDPEIRLAFCKSLVILRNRRIIRDRPALEIFFELVKIRDKKLRKFVGGSVISHLRKINSGQRDQRSISEVQNLLYTKLSDSRSIVVRGSLLVLIDAFRKKLLNLPKTANAISECCFNKVARVKVIAMRFFLGSTKSEVGLENESDSDDEESEELGRKTIKELTVGFRAAKKTRKKVKLFEKTKKALEKSKKSKKCVESKLCNWQAVQSLYDPQSFTDRLFGLLESRTNEKFEIRLLQMALCARVIGVHRLQTLGFYSYLHRYLQPRQREVTRFLLYAAQACHDLVPPDIVEQLVRMIAQNFVTDQNSPEAITVGLNAIREVFISCPGAATEELLRDLTEYKSYKNKNVSMAARGLITLFRNINPKLLNRKDRGRPTDATRELVGTDFGRSGVKRFVDGAECLITKKYEESDGCNEDTDVEKDAVANLSEDCSETDYENEDNGHGDSMQSYEDMDSSQLVSDVVCETEIEEKVENETQNTGVSVEKDDSSGGSTAKDLAGKAILLCESRILTDKEFQRISSYQLKKQVNYTSRAQRNRVKLDDMKLVEEFEEQAERRNAAIDLPKLKDIELFHKKINRQSKEDRLNSVKNGRVDRKEFSKPHKNGQHVGRTNREMAKRKNFMMVKQKIRGKNRQRSLRDQQLSLKRYLLRQAGRKC